MKKIVTLPPLWATTKIPVKIEAGKGVKSFKDALAGAALDLNTEWAEGSTELKVLFITTSGKTHEVMFEKVVGNVEKDVTFEKLTLSELGETDSVGRQLILHAAAQLGSFIAEFDGDNLILVFDCLTLVGATPIISRIQWDQEDIDEVFELEED